jgi:hypothetical protein
MWLQRIRSRFPHCCVFLVGTKIDQRPIPPPITLSSKSSSSGGSGHGRNGSGSNGMDRNSPDRTTRGSPIATASALSRSGSATAMASSLSSSSSHMAVATSRISPSPSSSSIADMAGIVTTTTTSSSSSSLSSSRRYLTREEGHACASAADSGSSTATTAAATTNDINTSPIPNLPLRYMECSARTRENLQAIFDNVVQTVRHQRILAATPIVTTQTRGSCIIC